MTTTHRTPTHSPVTATATSHRSMDGEADRQPRWIRRHTLLAYTLVAYGITWSLLIGGFFGSRAGILNPDGALVGLIVQLAAAGPLMAALVVVSHTSGRAGLAELGRSVIRWRVSPLWYAFVFLAVPLLMVGMVTAFYAAEMLPALGRNWSLLYTQLPIGVLSVALITGLAEEPGWRGCAQPTANRHYSPLVAALAVSVIWAGWHLPNALFGSTAMETVTHFVATLVNGFVLAWTYNSTGSVLIVMLLHGAQNATAALVPALLAGSAGGPSTSVYYLISAATFGVLMVCVAVLTRGRLGVK